MQVNISTQQVSQVLADWYEQTYGVKVTAVKYQAEKDRLIVATLSTADPTIKHSWLRKLLLKLLY